MIYNKVKPGLILIGCLILIFSGQLQAQRKMEKLGRGTIAIRENASSVFISWRIMAHELDNGTTYNLYRDDVLVASNLEVSNYTDNNTENSLYSVAAVVNGVEQNPSPHTNIYSSQVITVPIQNIGNYFVHLAWVGDLNGDGEYEIVVDRIPNIEGNTCKVEAYNMDGTRLWQVDMGPLSINMNNIEGGAAAISNGMWDGVTVYDLDMDGKSEVIIKSADGTIFGDETSLDYSNSDIQNFVSVLNGETGAEKARIALPSDYAFAGPLQTQFTIAYLDGINPSIVVKCKNRNDDKSFNLLVAAYSYDGQLTETWKFKPSGRPTPEFHQLRIADVDLDGKDEVCDGGYVLNEDGNMLYTMGEQGIVHGDRFHIGDFDPQRPGLEGYGIQQDNNSGLAWYYYDAKDGTMLQTQFLSSIGDFARGNVADIDPNHEGYEMWTFTDGIYNVQDGKITDRITDSYPNFRLWWDGDVQSEMLDGEKFNDWNYETDYEERILTASNWGASATWRKAPVFYGDIFGDWREEVIFEKSDHSSLLIFTTTIPTSERIYTLAQNPEYRLCMATKGYYQSAQLDYYLGYGMTTIPIPQIMQATAIWTGTNSKNWNETEDNWQLANAMGKFAQGDTVLFGIHGQDSNNVFINTKVEPELSYVLSPTDYIFSGNGEISGTGNFIKSGYSAVTLDVKCTYTGTTKVEQGTLIINNTNLNSKIVVYGGAAFGGKGTIGDTCTFENRSVLLPGDLNKTGTLTFQQSIKLTNGLICKFDISNDSTNTIKPSDKIIIEGDLTIDEGVVFAFNAINDDIKAGTYPLLQYSKTLKTDLSKITIAGLTGYKYDITDSLNSVMLNIYPTRKAGTVIWSGKSPSWDLLESENWLLNGNPSMFVSNDTVIFNETGISQPDINLVKELSIGKMEVYGDNVTYYITGEGSINGDADLIKNNNGTIHLASDNNTYSGKTIINGGTLIANKIDLAGAASSIGANPSTSPSEFIISDAVFSLNSTKSNYTNKGILLNGSSDTIDVNNNGTLSVSGLLEGDAMLVKKGKGTLYIMNNDNSYSGGTLIESGTIQLNDPGNGANIGALGSGTVTFKGGKLSMGNTREYTDCNLNFHIPKGFKGTIETDQRCNYKGKLTGDGELKVVLPGSIDRTIFMGDWSQFSGTVSVSGEGPMRLSNSSGYKNLSFILASNMTLYYSTGTSGGDNIAQTIHIGSISGKTSSILKDENWVIGEKNDTTVFKGKITGRSLTKEGKGKLFLQGASTYSGGTNINSGTLVAYNNSGSATGSGTVNVNSGAILEGNGKINGKLNINDNATLFLKLEYNNLTINNTVNISDDGILKVEISTLENSASILNMGSHTLNLNGSLIINNIDSVAYQEGDRVKIFDCNDIKGRFHSIIPAYPNEGMEWDTTLLYNHGVLRVVPEGYISAINIDLSNKISLFPNPVNDRLYIDYPNNIDIDGIRVTNTEGKRLITKDLPGVKEIDFAALKKGVYYIEMIIENRIITKKIIKN